MVTAINIYTTLQKEREMPDNRRGHRFPLYRLLCSIKKKRDLKMGLRIVFYVTYSPELRRDD